MEITADIAPRAPFDRAAYNAEHQRTYVRFLHLLRWCVAHIVFDLVAVACFVTGHGWAGLLLLVIGTVVLVFGVLTTRASVDAAVQKLTSVG